MASSTRPSCAARPAGDPLRALPGSLLTTGQDDGMTQRPWVSSAARWEPVVGSFRAVRVASGCRWPGPRQPRMAAEQWEVMTLARQVRRQCPSSHIHGGGKQAHGRSAARRHRGRRSRPVDDRLTTTAEGLIQGPDAAGVRGLGPCQKRFWHCPTRPSRVGLHRARLCARTHPRTSGSEPAVSALCDTLRQQMPSVFVRASTYAVVGGAGDGGAPTWARSTQ